MIPLLCVQDRKNSICALRWPVAKVGRRQVSSDHLWLIRDLAAPNSALGLR